MRNDLPRHGNAAALCTLDAAACLNYEEQSIWDFYKKNKSGGPWDFKPRLQHMLNLLLTGDADNAFPIRGNTTYEFNYDLWANIHYGFVGSAAGFSRGELQFAAAHAPGVGVNDAADVISIDIGVHLWDDYHTTLRPYEIQSAIMEAVPQYVEAQAASEKIHFLQAWTNGY